MERTAVKHTERVVETVVRPEAARVDREAAWPESGLRAMQEEGLGGLVVPTDAGGLGHGMLGLTQVCEALGQACPSTAMCFGMHCVGTAAIAARHTPQQQQAFLEPIARGEHLTTLALSEPSTGSHFWFPQTQLERAEAGYRVRGRKTFVTNGGHADSYVVSTIAAEADAPPGMFSCVMIPASAEGVTWGPPWDGIGMRGNSSISMELNDVLLSADKLLGEEGAQVWYVFHVIAPYFLMAMTGTYLGIAAGALDRAREHLNRRQLHHTGQSLAQQPILQHRLGTLWGDLERTRRLSYHAAVSGDTGDPEALPAIFSAKAEVAETAVNVVNEAMTLMGGIAYRENGGLGQMLRDVRAAHVMAPTTDVLRLWAGRALLNQPLLGE
jgi:alkylation response protein AidB-like acyl-CoA dehydrogenase